MKLRDDPEASSAMAGVLAQSNSFKLTGALGRRPTDTELYMAHFMGVGGAAKLINNAQDNPQASGAALFPNAAAANRSIFYDRTGSARSVSEVYSVLASRYAGAAASPATRTAMAAMGETSSRVASADASATTAAPAAIDSAAYLSSFPDVRSVTPVASTTSTAITVASATPSEPMFRTLFQAGNRSEPISPAVRDMWGNTTSAASSSGTPEVSKPRPLDLFSDRAGIFSS
jgi:hypothetical protein